MLPPNHPQLGTFQNNWDYTTDRWSKNRTNNISKDDDDDDDDDGLWMMMTMMRYAISQKMETGI